jgi:membrane protease YdiL (CAAX protease family)
MNGQVTSLQSAGTWRRFGAFLLRPELPGHVTGMRAAALPVLARLFALDLALMAGLILLAAMLVALGVELPQHMLEGFPLDLRIILFILVAAPIGEELIFRAWLSGRAGHAAASAVLLLGGGTYFYAVRNAGIEPQTGLAILVGASVLAALFFWLSRASQPMAVVRRNFRWFYLGSALAFASVHLVNFTGPALILLPLTLPQLLLGLILGYARVRFGLWSCILLHAAHNALFLGLILAGAG